jgi:hypothetical protein
MKKPRPTKLKKALASKGQAKTKSSEVTDVGKQDGNSIPSPSPTEPNANQPSEAQDRMVDLVWTWPETNANQSPETVSDMLERLRRQWFWLLDSRKLQDFENDPYAQGYEVLRRHPAHALKPGAYMPALPAKSNVFREAWPRLNDWERQYIRSLWSREIAAFGLIYEPPIVGTEAIYFRCDQPPEYLYQAAKSRIECAIRMRKEEEARQVREIPHETGPIPWQKYREAIQKQHEEKCAPPDEPSRTTTKPCDPTLVFGSDGCLIVPKFVERPRTDGQKPSTSCNFKWEAQTPEGNPADVVLHLPTKLDSPVFGEPPTERRMYADEIVACFRTFLTKPPKDFAEHRRRISRRVARLRRPDARSITLGLMAFDFREATPMNSFKALAKFCFKKASRRLATSERQLWTGLSNGLASIKKLHSGLNKTAMR